MDTATNQSIRILMVEDSAIQAELLRRLLADCGFDVTAAGNGAEGLAAARAAPPQLVISDISMPVMDGYRMCAEIKADAELRGIPVILLTALSDPADVIRGLSAGADAYLTKPYDGERLLGQIRSLLAPRHEGSTLNDVAAGANDPLQVLVDGHSYEVVATRRQILNLLVSTYDNAVHQNRRLMAVEEELVTLNRELEKRVRERTDALAAEEARTRTMEVELEVNDQRIAELTREIEALGQLTGRSTESAESPAALAAAKDALVERYVGLIDLAVERQAYRVEHDISGALRKLAQDMGAYGAGPRDVVELHGNSLRKRITGLKPELKWAYMEEGRLMVLELMGYLASHYRQRCSPGGSSSERQA